MGRPKNTEPSYLRHKASGQARTIIDGRTKYLGPYGSDESWAEFRRLKAEWKARQANGAPPAASLDTQIRTIDDLVDRFWVHVEAYYRNRDGTPSTEVDSFRQSLRPLRRLYGHTRVADFGPLSLKTVRQAMINGSWMTAEEKTRGRRKNRTGWARKLVNQRIGRIIRMFAWAVAEELIPVNLHLALKAVATIKKNRTEARETPKARPAPVDLVEQVFAELGPTVQAMVRLQQYTGMRPGEVCRLKPRDIDREGVTVDGVRIWVYRPLDHKGEWRDQDKAVPIGPRAQLLLKPFLDRDPAAHCFSPAEEIEALRTDAAEHSRFRSRRKPGAHNHGKGYYTVKAYGKRIRATCDRLGVPRWHAHQLRHLVGTQVASQYDLDTARAVLDHESPQTTLIYAARDLEKAARVVAKIG